MLTAYADLGVAIHEIAVRPRNASHVVDRSIDLLGGVPRAEGRSGRLEGRPGERRPTTSRGQQTIQVNEGHLESEAQDRRDNQGHRQITEESFDLGKKRKRI